MRASRNATQVLYNLLRAADRVFGAHSWKLDGRKPERILAICLSHLGDLVLLTPLFTNLRLRFPHSHIAVVCKSAVADIPRNHPAVNEVLTYEARWTLRPESPRAGFLESIKLIREVRAGSYDLLVICYDHPMDRILGFCTGIHTQVCLDDAAKQQPKPAVGIDHHRHRVEHAYDLLRALDAPILETAPSVGLCEADLAWADEWLQEQGVAGSRLLGVHPGAGGPEKRWAADRFARVAEHLAGKFDCKVVVTGSPVDAEAVQGFVESVRTTVVQAPVTLTVARLCALTRRFALLLCNDCGPMHIAAALRVPVIAVFGPSSPELFGPCPADPRHVVVKSSDGRMESVTVEQVVAAIAGSPHLMHQFRRESSLVLKSPEEVVGSPAAADTAACAGTRSQPMLEEVRTPDGRRRS
jgi:ADP-heptose:LPS heptosyltransferase